MNIGHKTLRIVAASILILGTVALAAPSAGTRARQGGGPRWRGMGGQPQLPGRFDAITRHLDLTDEQAEKIQRISEENRQDADATRETLAEARKTLRDAVADGAEEEQIRAAAESVGKAVADQAVLQSKTLASIREVLTDEQREQLKQFKGRIGPFRGQPGWGEPRGRMGAGRGNRPRRMGNPGPRGPWDGQRGPARWSDDGPGARRGGWGAQFRGRGQGQQGRRGGQWQRGTDWQPTGDWGCGPRRMNRTPRFGRGPQAGLRGPAGGRGPLPIGRMFERADTNGDGALDREEIKAFRSRRADGPETRPW